MFRVGKTVPPKRQILKDISLSFFPGAKIGILGLNGAGKSSLLRIMAGVDTEFDGDAAPAANLTIGYLEQEPKLDPEMTVREAVEEGLGELIAARKRLEELYAEYGDPDADFDKLAEEQSKLEAVSASCGRRSRSTARDRGRRAASAAMGCEDRAALRRREAPRRAMPFAALEARHAAARRTDQPSRRRRAWSGSNSSCSAFRARLLR